MASCRPGRDVAVRHYDAVERRVIRTWTRRASCSATPLGTAAAGDLDVAALIDWCADRQSGGARPTDIEGGRATPRYTCDGPVDHTWSRQ